VKATEILMSEHRIIERVLDALETAARQLESGNPVRPEYFLDAADFIAGFADGCHHRKEEGVLFVELAASGMPADQGPIGVMLDEHEQGRAFTRGIREAARKLAEGDAEARRALIASAKGYVALLRDHITKEDEVLFPMADQLIPAHRHDQVLAGFARVEHLDAGPGVHQKFLDLADRLTAPWLSANVP
jgi:hemerythrin-like domain-containing protein